MGAIGTLTVLAMLILGGCAFWEWFDWLEPRVMYAFARFWHGCSRGGPASVPAAGPALLVANHPSPADPAFLMATCPRPIGFLHAREYFEVRGLRWLFRRAGCIPVRRDGRDVGAVRAALRRLREGATLAIFPDTFVEGEVRAAAPRAGAALIALRSRVPVIPAHIVGAPPGRSVLAAWLWPSRGVRVVYGAPVDLTAYYDRPINRRLLREVTLLLMQRIADLQPEPAGSSLPDWSGTRSRPERRPAGSTAAGGRAEIAAEP